MPIENLEIYNARMAAGYADKLFFLEKLDALGEPDKIDTVVDFGCADGEMFKYLPKRWKKIGVDNSAQMRKAAAENYPAADYVSSLYEANRLKEGKTLLIMSSVLHEIYSYCPKDETDDIWKAFREGAYDFIAIRDMCPSKAGERKADKDAAEKVLSSSKRELFEDFRTKFLKGKEEFTQNDLVHFLLKYRYKENWDRERDEDYFSFSQEELCRRISSERTEIIYMEHFVLPYIRETVKTDIGYEIKDATHLKMLARRT